jgi:hypothetical protein
VKVLEQELRASRDRFEVGDLTRTDVAQSEARLALANANLQAARGHSELLKPETFQFLHVPPGKSEYSGGWIVVNRPWAKGRTLAHNGSNTMWYATVWIAPEIDTAYLVVTNQGGSAGQKVCDTAVSEMIKWQAARDAAPP